ncbi:vitamin B12-dependent ribonucleotide reductase [Candidatus Parcubacteria bacterium]|nr:MAG: vitamin B12-dependent ribonucleotide reductase [Candidatus Parcubacteria bacterium]
MTPSSSGALHQQKSKEQKNSSGSEKNLELKRFFTKEGEHPFNKVNWVERDAIIGKNFEYKGLEFPDFWSQNAVNITASKYFRGEVGTSRREKSLKQVITRVASTIRGWGEQFGYFENSNKAQVFEDELTHILLHQKAAFNSPVWFNVGITPKPQCSACFILSVEDNMPSILQWIYNEGMIFKGGSGAGINLSALRSSHETLLAGGHSSGPVAFMRGADSVAGMIKSGGSTRRAAKMVILNVDHPDIMEFIRAKAEEEKKVQALMSAGYNMQDLNDPGWTSIQYQNANNSVRVTDEFMRAVESNGKWQTHFIKDGRVAGEYDAKGLLMEIAKAAWECADPGIQFDTTINEWHTCPNSGRINASNPCSEYMHLDDSACNLASINLMKFLKQDGSFAVEDFKHTVDVIILAQEIIVGGSSYPTEKITKNALAFRELGMGFANLGAFLMAKGLPYDSDRGRALAGAITALMTGEAYRYSAEIAAKIGPFEGYSLNREPMLRVIKKHGDAFEKVNHAQVGDEALVSAAREAWAQALRLGEKHGFRNSQATVLAPTGTIAFMMDCDTTGVEPDFSLVKNKQLVGGGWMKIVNSTVSLALENLGYSKEQVSDIVSYIEKNSMVEGAPHMKDEHLAVFDCAVRPAHGKRSISWQGHVKMVGAVQPFISGAISKTFNMSHDTSVEEIFEAYRMGWHWGLKAFAVYRDGSKAAQPLQTSSHSKKGTKEQLSLAVGTSRKRLPATRVSKTHKFSIAGHEGYVTYSFYEDGKPAEIFIRMSKQGSTLAGLLDVFAIAVSMALQYGVPLKDLARKFIYSRFEPSGYTENENIQIATSIADYIFRYLALEFLSEEDLAEFAMTRPQASEHGSSKEEPQLKQPHAIDKPKLQVSFNGNGNGNGHGSAHTNGNGNGSGLAFSDTVCKRCGGMMIRTGSCRTCLQCGTSDGGCS